MDKDKHSTPLWTREFLGMSLGNFLYHAVCHDCSAADRHYDGVWGRRC